MKIEFLDDLTGGGKYTQVVSEQLVRLFDFSSSEAAELKNAIEKFVIAAHEELNLASLQIITEVNCSLTLRLADEDIGLTTTDKKDFFCYLTEQGYKYMIYLMEPFCDDELNGYQWLYELDNPIDFLFSRGGTW